ncbi:ROK family transcriptional regulator [Paenibacillus chartarius]|uniref:ROK family transcriptional regulator n=1 Tax=Paenibacillus chartarius TaxID=747481 RepID=A0ABV6DK48_9BACL
MNSVRRELKQTGKMTKPQLASLTGLSVVTINALVKELVEAGELFEDDAVPSNGGRPAVTYRFNYNFRLALVVQIIEKQDHELYLAKIFNLREEILAAVEHRLQSFDMSALCSVIDDLLQQFPAVGVIGIGIPGQSVDGEIKVSGSAGMKGIRLIEEVQSRFEVPVVVENDVNAAVSGYCHREQFGEGKCVLGIYFPGTKSPGMGIFIDGKIVRGKDGMAGEIKYLPLDFLHWDALDAAEEFPEVICKMMLILNAVLAPDQIVVYSEEVDAQLLKETWDACKANYAMPSFPDIVVSASFAKDFEEGMRYLSLRELGS